MEYPSPSPPINGEINSFREDLDRGQRAVLIIDETRASNVRYSLSLSLSLEWQSPVWTPADWPRETRDVTSRRNFESASRRATRRCMMDRQPWNKNRRREHDDGLQQR